MANAILMNGKAGERVEIANSIIKSYKAQGDVISADNFIDFVNETYFTVGNTTSIANTSYSGYFPNEYQQQASGINYDTPTCGYYYNQHEPYIYKVSDTLILMFYTQPNTSTSTYGTAVLFEIKNNTVTAKNSIQMMGLGSNLAAIQLTDTMFITLAGSYKTCTSTSYPLQARAWIVDPTDGTLTAGSAVNIDASYYYYYMAVAGLYKVSDTSFICFYADGHNNTYSYPCCKVCTVTDAGVITVGTRYIYRSYSVQHTNLLYRTFQMSPTKYVEVTYYNYPVVQIVTVNGTTCSRSGYVSLAGTAYTDYQYVYGKPFMRGNFVYIPYYNGSTWTIASVNCTGTTPTVGVYQNMAVANHHQPVVTKVNENEVISAQAYSGVAYASYYKLNDQGGFDTSHLVLTVTEKVTALRAFKQIGPNTGVVLCSTYGQAGGLVAIPICWAGESLTAGAPQYWNEDYNWSDSYSIIRRVNDKYAIAIFSPYANHSKFNGLSCFSIYQDGTSMRRSEIYTINKIDPMYDQNQRSILGFYADEENSRAILLYRLMTAASASYYDLYISAIDLKGNKCYISPITKLLNDADTSARSFDYGNILHIENDQYVVLYMYSTSDIYGMALEVNPDLKVIPSENTGNIAGITLDQCDPTTAGRILVLGD